MTAINGTAAAVIQAIANLDPLPTNFNSTLTSVAEAADITAIEAANGNGTLSSLDASYVQRVVVELDSGFDAYDDLNPVLMSDTTGNGTLSSLDASRIQQQVVGLPVDSFPGITS